MTMEDRARLCAASVHMGQVDKAGRDYFAAHVADVVSRLAPSDGPGRTVAWLHDVVEDGHPDVLGQLHEEFPDAVVDAVIAITHRPHEPRDAYYARVKANPLALRVKLADIGSNADPARLALLDDATADRLFAKYAHAFEVLTA